MDLLGVDFSSAPSRRKPITVARGRRRGAVVRLQRVDELPTLAAFEALLAAPGPWFAAFDFPFGLPRAFVDDLELGGDTDAVIAELHRRCPDRASWRTLVDAWGQGRPRGARLVHRATDLALPGLKSTSPLQTRYVPVGFMYYEGLARLVGADVDLPGLRRGDPARRGVEGYPRLLAHAIVGRRSYKNDPGDDRRAARAAIVDALERGVGRLGLRLALPATLRERLIDDAAGDRLDAVLCLMQAAWAGGRADAGVPRGIDPVEGWIVGAG